MNAEFILCFVIYLCVALIMVGIGVSQMKSKTPVTFYSGEKPLEAGELSDVSMWNRKHGIMWVAYGIVIMLSGLAGSFPAGRESLWCLLPMMGGVIVPLVGMIWYHHRLLRAYRI